MTRKLDRDGWPWTLDLIDHVTRLSKAQQEAIRTMLAATGTVAIPERTLRPIVQAGIRLGRNADGATIWKSPENLKAARFAADTGLVWEV